jgi:nucleotide-binding universal stress UspA family protein
MGYWAGAYGMTPALIDEVGKDLENAGRETVDAVVADRGEAAAGVPVDVQAVPGPPAAALVGQSAEADLLVVGHRGLGGLRSAVLGSVGLQCVLHASCPVTVVPPHAYAR